MKKNFHIYIYLTLGWTWEEFSQVPEAANLAVSKFIGGLIKIKCEGDNNFGLGFHKRLAMRKSETKGLKIAKEPCINVCKVTCHL